jgi:hypothetical protein
MINDLKHFEANHNRAIPPMGIINFLHEGKNVSFNPLEMARFPDDIRAAFAETLIQSATVGYWWALMNRRYKEAERELDAYRGKLYHSLKAEGNYGEKYHGLRATEHGLEHAMATDKTFIEESATLDRLREIVDQLWNLHRLLEKKHDTLKNMAYLMSASQRADNLEEQCRKESGRASRRDYAMSPT